MRASAGGGDSGREFLFSAAVASGSSLVGRQKPKLTGLVKIRASAMTSGY